MMDPTARGDDIAARVRRWYEANRESWWARHRPGADRHGIHADEFMLRLIGAVSAAHWDVGEHEGCGIDSHRAMQIETLTQQNLAIQGHIRDLEDRLESALWDKV